jgi:hypothetical protein
MARDPRTAKARAGASTSREPAAPVPLGHPAMVAALVMTALLVLYSTTFVLFDTDFWQHLLVGKAIWQSHAAPTVQLWTWPTYGAPDINASWGFRALIWPFWSAGGVLGLFVWRWLSTLLVFGLLAATARRMGARGFAALLALVLCALIYRVRSQIRPETLVAVLLALEIWVLETRRLGGRDRAVWIVAIAWAWANAHISWYLDFVVLGIYLLDDLLRARRDDAAARRARKLAWMGLAALAISFVNPWGWRALWQPFEYYLRWRHEPIFQTIVELKPVAWGDYLATPLPWLVLGWPALIAWRASRGAFDRVEALLCLFFTALALSTQRFTSLYALVATPFLMRDLDAWAARVRWPARSARPATRAAFIGVVCVALAVVDRARVDPAVGVAIDYGRYPVKACDFIASSSVGGRGFNNFEYGGYQAWRFWPDRTRLPFIDVHQAGTTLDRRLYVGAFRSAEGWHALDDRHHFDYVLLTRNPDIAGRLPDVLDADTSWALVFADDAAVVFVRREGPLRGVVERFAYRHLAAGPARTLALGEACAADPVLRAAVKAELRREVASSPWNATALSLLANIALSEGRFDEAGELLARGLRHSPGLGRAHERLGLIALAEGRPREALVEFGRERPQPASRARIALLIGRAWQELGDRQRARDAYRRACVLDPGDPEAQDSLRASERYLGR